MQLELQQNWQMMFNEKEDVDYLTLILIGLLLIIWILYNIRRFYHNTK